MVKTTEDELLMQLDFSEPTVIILRGLPGAGKSTLANRICDRTYRSRCICSADKYWVQPDGTYKFDKNAVPLNHHQCLRDFCRHVGGTGLFHTQVIVLDNTNTAVREFAHYVEIANAYGYKIIMISLFASTEKAKLRNVHNVPDYTIAGMAERMTNSRNSQQIEEFNQRNRINHFTIEAD